MHRIQFLSTPSARRATLRATEVTHNTDISIHALREEGDSALPASTSGQNNFYPRPPRGGRLNGVSSSVELDTISIHALREEGDFETPTCTIFFSQISIHALREEGDCRGSAPCSGARHFYPRPPRGGRHALSSLMVRLMLFLSTPSARRATLSSMAKILRSWLFLSTPSARRATRSPVTLGI